MNYQRNKKYFEGVSFEDQAKMILAGFVIFITGIFLIKTFLSIALGAVIAGLGVWIISIKRKNIVTDSEYDASVAAVLSSARARALKKLGIDEEQVNEIKPISFGGHVYEGASYSKQGSDGYWRTNKYEVVMLFFSEHEVHCYTYTFDTTEPKQTEATDVYFYRDIVSVSTATDTATIQGKNIEYEYFKLTTAGGTALSVSLRNVNDAQRSINAMRGLLKTKKQY